MVQDTGLGIETLVSLQQGVFFREIVEHLFPSLYWFLGSSELLQMPKPPIRPYVQHFLACFLLFLLHF